MSIYIPVISNFQNIFQFMGNTKSENYTPQKSQLNISQLHQQNTLKHLKFRNAKIRKDNNDVPYIELTQPVSNKIIYINWKQRIEQFSKCFNEIPLMLPINLQFTQQAFCGSSGTIKIKYDYFPFMLSDELSNRKQLDRFFSQEQIWYVLYIFILTLGTIHKKNKTLGDVRPQNSFINQNGQILLGNYCTFIQQPPNYEKTRMFHQITYLAPEVLQDLEKGYNPSVKASISQNFSVGVTLLDVCLLTNSKDLYTQKRYALNIQLLEKRLRQLSTRIDNKILLTIILGLCEMDPRQRLRSEDILQILQPCQEKIINLEKFEVKNLSEKFKAAISKYSIKKVIIEQQIRQTMNIPNNVQYQLPQQSMISQHYQPQIQIQPSIISQPYQQQQSNVSYQSNQMPLTIPHQQINKNSLYTNNIPLQYRPPMSPHMPRPTTPNNLQINISYKSPNQQPQQQPRSSRQLLSTQKPKIIHSSSTQQLQQKNTYKLQQNTSPLKQSNPIKLQNTFSNNFNNTPSLNKKEQISIQMQKKAMKFPQTQSIKRQTIYKQDFIKSIKNEQKISNNNKTQPTNAPIEQKSLSIYQKSFQPSQFSISNIDSHTYNYGEKISSKLLSDQQQGGITSKKCNLNIIGQRSQENFYANNMQPTFQPSSNNKESVNNYYNLNSNYQSPLIQSKPQYKYATAYDAKYDNTDYIEIDRQQVQNKFNQWKKNFLDNNIVSENNNNNQKKYEFITSTTPQKKQQTFKYENKYLNDVLLEKPLYNYNYVNTNNLKDSTSQKGKYNSDRSKYGEQQNIQIKNECSTSKQDEKNNNNVNISTYEVGKITTSLTNNSSPTKNNNMNYSKYEQALKNIQMRLQQSKKFFPQNY